MADMRVRKRKGRKNRVPKLTRVETLTRGLLADPRDVKAMFSIKEEEGKGRGVFLKKDILRKDSFVLEYEGDIISESEAQGREKIYAHNNEGCFIMFFTFNGAKWAIDATRRFNSYTRLLNHSRRPNIRFHSPILIDLNGKGLPRVAAYALRDIYKGEEIVFDYGVRDAAIPWLKNRKAGYTSDVSESSSDEDEEKQKETEGCQMSMMISPFKAPCIDDYTEASSHSSSCSTDKTGCLQAPGLPQTKITGQARRGLARKGYSIGEWGMRFTCLCPWSSEKSYMIGFENIGVPQKIHRFIEDCSKRHRNKSDTESVICLSTSSDGSINASETSAAKLRESLSHTGSDKPVPSLASSLLPCNTEPDSINKVLDWDIPSPEEEDSALKNIKIISVQSLSESHPVEMFTHHANPQGHCSSDRQQNLLVNQPDEDESIKVLQNNSNENRKAILHQSIKVSESPNNNQARSKPTFAPGTNVLRQANYRPVHNGFPKQDYQNERDSILSSSLSLSSSCKQQNKQFINKFPQAPSTSAASSSGLGKVQSATSVVSHKGKNVTGSPKQQCSSGLAASITVPRHQCDKPDDNSTSSKRQHIPLKANAPSNVPHDSGQQLSRPVSNLNNSSASLSCNSSHISSKLSAKSATSKESPPRYIDRSGTQHNKVDFKKTQHTVENIAKTQSQVSSNSQKHSRCKTNPATPVFSTSAMSDQQLNKVTSRAPVRLQCGSLDHSIVIIDHSESDHEKDGPNPAESKASSSSSASGSLNSIKGSKALSPKGKKRTTKQTDVCIISDDELSPNNMAAKKPKQVIKKNCTKHASDTTEMESSSSECEIVMEEGLNAGSSGQSDKRVNSMPARRVVGFSPTTSPPQVAVIKPYVAPTPKNDNGTSSPCSPSSSTPVSETESSPETTVLTEAEMEHLRKIFDICVFHNKVSSLDIQENIYKNWDFFKDLIERGISINQIRSAVRKFLKPTL